MRRPPECGTGRQIRTTARLRAPKIVRVLSLFDPLVGDWFRARFDKATEPQVLGWPAIREGRDVLISAPTGSGKTLAAFLLCIDDLVRQARLGPLPDQTEVLYVSPLKALSNDVHKNLDIPLGGICGVGRGAGHPAFPDPNGAAASIAGSKTCETAPAASERRYPPADSSSSPCNAVPRIVT